MRSTLISRATALAVGFLKVHHMLHGNLRNTMYCANLAIYDHVRQNLPCRQRIGDRDGVSQFTTCFRALLVHRARSGALEQKYETNGIKRTAHIKGGFEFLENVDLTLSEALATYRRRNEVEVTFKLMLQNQMHTARMHLRV